MKKILLTLLNLVVSYSVFPQWQTTTGPTGAGNISSLDFKSPNVIAGTVTGGVFLSSDSGVTWTPSNNGLTNISDIRSLTHDDANIFAAAYNSLSTNAVFKSVDDGANWTATPLSFNFTHSLAIKPGMLLAGTWSGVSFSTDSGTTWGGSSMGLPSIASICGLAFSGTKIFAGVCVSSSGGTGMYTSTNNGANYVPFNSGGMTTSTIVNKVAVIGGKVYAGTGGGGVFKSPATNTTSNWTPVNNGLTATTITAFHVVGNTLFAGGAGSVFVTEDEGANWIDIGAGLPVPSHIYSITSDGVYLYAGADSMVWKRDLSEVVTGIGNKNYNTSFTVSPNPVTNESTLSISSNRFSGKDYSVSVINTMGEKFDVNIKDEESKKLLDISMLPAGIYFIRLECGKESVTKKIVKI